MDNSEENEKIIIVEPKESLRNYKEGSFSISEDTKIECTMDIKRGNTLTVTTEDPKLDFDIEETLKKSSREAKNISINLDIGGRNRSIGNDEGFRRMYKVVVDKDYIKAGYFTMGMLGKTVYALMLVTTHATYSGIVKFNREYNNDQAKEKWIDSILKTIEPLNVDKRSLIELEELEDISFMDKKIYIDTLIIDQINELNYIKEKLPKDVELVATSKKQRETL